MNYARTARNGGARDEALKRRNGAVREALGLAPKPSPYMWPDCSALRAKPLLDLAAALTGAYHGVAVGPDHHGYRRMLNAMKVDPDDRTSFGRPGILRRDW